MESDEFKRQLRYEGYTDAIKNQSHGYSEAYDAAAGAVRAQERKKYEDDLIEAAMTVISDEPPNVNTSFGVGFVRRLDDANTDNSPYVREILLRIVEMPGAFPEARAMALDKLLRANEEKIEAKVLDAIQKSFESGSGDPESFENLAQEKAFEYLKSRHRSRNDPDTPSGKIYSFITAAIESGKFDEGKTRNLIRMLQYVQLGNADQQFIRTIRSAKNGAPDLPRLIDRMLE